MALVITFQDFYTIFGRIVTELTLTNEISMEHL